MVRADRAYAACEHTPERGFQVLLGSRRGAPRSYDALLAGKPGATASAQAEALVAQLRAGQTSDAVAVLDAASGHPNLYVLNVSAELAGYYAERGPGRWQHAADAALDVFSLDVPSAGATTRLDETARQSWRVANYEFLQFELELRLRAGGWVQAQWLQERADETCRAAFVSALAGQCQRAPASLLEALLGASLAEVRKTLTAAPSPLRPAQPYSAEAMVAVFGVGDWERVVERWLNLLPIDAEELARVRARRAGDEHSQVLLGEDLASAFLAALPSAPAAGSAAD